MLLNQADAETFVGFSNVSAFGSCKSPRNKQKKQGIDIHNANFLTGKPMVESN